MKYLLTTIAALSALALFLTGCRGNTATSYADNCIAFSRVDADKDFRAVGSAADYGQDHDLVISCRADLLIPTAAYGQDVTPLQDTILKFAFDTVGSDHAALIEAAFRREAREVGYALADTAVTDSSFDGLFTATGDVVAMSPQILSYGVTTSSYYPRAAHGMYATTYVNYDIEGGRVFGLRDIVNEEGIDKLPEILGTVAESLKNSIGSVQLSELPAGDNFYVNTDDVLIFVYQPYEDRKSVV